MLIGLWAGVWQPWVLTIASSEWVVVVKVTNLLINTERFSFGVRAWTEMVIWCLMLKVVSSEKNLGVFWCHKMRKLLLHSDFIFSPPLIFLRWWSKVWMQEYRENQQSCSFWRQKKKIWPQQNKVMASTNLCNFYIFFVRFCQLLSIFN